MEREREREGRKGGTAAQMCGMGVDGGRQEWGGTAENTGKGARDICSGGADREESWLGKGGQRWRKTIFGRKGGEGGVGGRRRRSGKVSHGGAGTVKGTMTTGKGRKGRRSGVCRPRGNERRKDGKDAKEKGRWLMHASWRGREEVGDKSGRGATWGLCLYRVWPYRHLLPRPFVNGKVGAGIESRRRN